MSLEDQGIVFKKLDGKQDGGFIIYMHSGITNCTMHNDCNQFEGAKN